MNTSAQAISARDYAAILDVSERTIHRLAKRDGHVLGVPALQVAGVLRFSSVQVERVLAADNEGPAAAR